MSSGRSQVLAAVMIGITLSMSLAVGRVTFAGLLPLRRR